MDELKEWVKDNRIIVGLVGVLSVLLIGLLTFNQVKSPMERGLEEDRDKTIALQEQKEVVQQEIQEQTVTIQLNSALILQHRYLTMLSVWKRQSLMQMNRLYSIWLVMPLRLQM